MRLSGLIVFIYIFTHLIDYTFTPHTIENSSYDGHYLGLYGHVYNSFLNPIRVVWYITAMFAIALHLIHVYRVLFKRLDFIIKYIHH